MKNLKRKIAILLTAVLVLSIDVPAFAKVNTALPEETVITGTEEIVSSEVTATRDIIEPERSEGTGLDENLPEQVITERDATEEIISEQEITQEESSDVIEPLGAGLNDWLVSKSDYSNAVLDTDYTYDTGNNTITILNNSGNVGEGKFLKITPRLSGSELTIINSSSLAVPVMITVAEGHGGVSTLTVQNSGSNGGFVKLGNSNTIALKKTVTAGSEGNLSIVTYSYISGVSDALDDGTYLIAHRFAMADDEATIVRDTNEIRIKNGTVAALIPIEKSGEYDGLFYYSNETPNSLFAIGSGKYAIYATGVSSVFSNQTIRFLSFTTCELGDARVTVSDTTSSTISGVITGLGDGYAYEVAAFRDNDYTQMEGFATVAADGSYTITGLSAETPYYVAVRSVYTDEATRFKIASDGILHVPSEWRCMEETVSTLPDVPPYEITAAAGSTLNMGGSGSSKTASLKTIVFCDELKYSQSAGLVLKYNGTALNSGVTWTSDNPDAVEVDSSTGAIAIAQKAKDGDKAVITATHNDTDVANLSVTVKYEGGTVSLQNMSGIDITGLSVQKGSTVSFNAVYPATMATGLTLTATKQDDGLVTRITEQSITLGKTFTVSAADTTGDTNIAVTATYKATNNETYEKTLTLPLNVHEKELALTGVTEGNNCQYIKIDTTGAAVVAEFEGAKYTSGDTGIATVDEDTGVITPVKAGVVRFTAVSGDVTMNSPELYIVDPTPSAIVPTFAARGRDFRVSADFPMNYYEVTGIELTGTDNPAVTATSYSGGTLFLDALSRDSLDPATVSADDAALTFSVTAKSRITGETGVTSTVSGSVRLLDNVTEHDGEVAPEPESANMDISQIKYKAYQVENNWNLFDVNSHTTVYFVGDGIDPDEVTGDSKYFDYETVAGCGYTKVIITLKKEYQKNALLKDIAKAKKISFTLKKGESSNTQARLTLKMSNSLPKYSLTSKSATACPDAAGHHSATFTVSDKNGNFELWNNKVIYVANKNSSTAVSGIGVTNSNNTATIQYNEAGEQKLGGLYITSNDWVEGAYVFAPFKITYGKPNAVPSIKLGKTSATIARDAGQNFSTEIYINGGMVLADSDYKLSYDESAGFRAAVKGGRLVISLPNQATAGKYEIKIDSAEASPVKTRQAKFKLTITDKVVKVSYSVKGKLDCVADDTAVYVYPKLTNVSGNIRIAESTETELNTKHLIATVEDNVIVIKKDTDSLLIHEPVNKPVPFMEKGNVEFGKFMIVVGNSTEVGAKLNIPVVIGKLTASGTGIDFKKNPVQSGTSVIEAVYTYNIYNSAGKVSTKGYYTLTGSALTLSNAKCGKVPVKLSDKKPGCVLADNLGDEKNYNGSVKVTIRDTSIKTVAAKFKVIGK